MLVATLYYQVFRYIAQEKWIIGHKTWKKREKEPKKGDFEWFQAVFRQKTWKKADFFWFFMIFCGKK